MAIFYVLGSQTMALCVEITNLSHYWLTQLSNLIHICIYCINIMSNQCDISNAKILFSCVSDCTWGLFKWCKLHLKAITGRKIFLLLWHLWSFFGIFRAWQSLVTIQFHCMEKSTVIILPDISFCVWWNKENQIGLEQHKVQFWVKYTFNIIIKFCKLVPFFPEDRIGYFCGSLFCVCERFEIRNP